MSCKALLYTTNTTTQTVAAGGVIAPGTIQRRVGNTRCCTPVITLNGNNIVLTEPGYYSVQVDVTDAVIEAGAVTVSLVQDGNVIESVTGTAAAAGDAVNITLSAPIVRVFNCTASNLSIVLTAGAGNVTSVGISVIKL